MTSPEQGASQARIAYFSMEIALEPEIPTYAGGLGVLAGDTLRAAADVGLPLVAVSLLHRHGYFVQRLDEQGRQSELPAEWDPADYMERCEETVTISIEGRNVEVAAWRYQVRGIEGDSAPVYLLDTDLEGNSEWDRRLTDRLYGGDHRYRLCQEVVLGIGGAALLDRLGHDGIRRYHLNEGHAALLVLALAERRLEGSDPGALSPDDIEQVRRLCVFTTHTPVPAGHDRFSRDLAVQVLGEARTSALARSGGFEDHELNMTYLALRGSGYVNGVAMEHGEISRGMFPGYPISAITNGVHAPTWVCPSFAALYDQHVPDWRRDHLYLRYVRGVSAHDIRAAHAQAKQVLIERIGERTGAEFDPKTFTIGFARRAAEYKRADLLLSSPERLRWISENVGPIQLVFAGKAHPSDEMGKSLIEKVFQAAGQLGDSIRFVYIEDYDMAVAKWLCSGVDLWLNTPLRPREASGTSGMKAAINGVPSLSVLDGWWVEGHVEGVTGWAIGHGGEVREDAEAEAASMYAKLENTILPMYYGRPHAYAQVMRSTIALNGSFFTTRRMIMQYLSNAYAPGLTMKKLLAAGEID